MYIHIPFCESRCIYCGFYSTTLASLKEEYVDAILREMEMRRDSFTEPLRTIYFGGGTPSTLPTELLQRIIGGINKNYDTTEVVEWTMECNPDDVTPEFARWIGTSPINRVSMGAQTFDDKRLRWLRRRHVAGQVSEAVSLLRANGITNISIDLMFGFPGQTVEEWLKDITTLVRLNPEHISAYSLMYEEGTPLGRMLDNGEVKEISEEDSREMYYTLIDTLTKAGYEHYEISNFAKADHESVHNSSYWHDVPYIGIGAAAHSFDKVTRSWNVSDVRKYINAINNGTRPYEDEAIDTVTRYNDLITTALRTRQGIDITKVTASNGYGEDAAEYLLRQAEPLIAQGMLARDGNFIHLTRKALFVSDNVMVELIM